jgi:hypothetical protein
MTMRLEKAQRIRILVMLPSRTQWPVHQRLLTPSLQCHSALKGFSIVLAVEPINHVGPSNPAPPGTNDNDHRDDEEDENEEQSQSGQH